jgi:hypothetical protein
MACYRKAAGYSISRRGGLNCGQFCEAKSDELKMSK